MDFSFLFMFFVLALVANLAAYTGLAQFAAWKRKKKDAVLEEQYKKLFAKVEQQLKEADTAIRNAEDTILHDKDKTKLN